MKKCRYVQAHSQIVYQLKQYTKDLDSMWVSFRALTHYPLPTFYQYLRSSAFASIQITDECIHAMHNLRSRKSASQKLRFIIFKVADNNQSVVVEETSSEPDYEMFRQKLCSTHDSSSVAPPRFAAYDVEYDLGQDGKR